MRSGTPAVTGPAASSLTRSAPFQQQPLNLLVAPRAMRGVLQLLGWMSVGDGDHLHAGGEAGCDPGLGILHHAAALGGNVEQFCRTEEDVRRRLAVLNVRIADHGGEEAAQ